MSKIDKAIEYVEMELESYKHPGAYLDEEYYIQCDAKVDVLQDVLYRLKSIKDGVE